MGGCLLAWRGARVAVLRTLNRRNFDWNSSILPAIVVRAELSSITVMIDPTDPFSRYVDSMAYLARAYGGFTQPWKSEIDPRNGEDAYTALVEEHLGPNTEVIEAGCGHGAEALDRAKHVKSWLAFDAVPEFIALADKAAAERGVDNVRFVVADCSPKRNGGRARLPAADQSADLVLSRRGPSSWIGDATRVVRPGGALIHVALYDCAAAGVERRAARESPRARRTRVDA